MSFTYKSGSLNLCMLHISKAPKINFGHVAPSLATAPPHSAVDVLFSSPLPASAPSPPLPPLVDVILPPVLPGPAGMLPDDILSRREAETGHSIKPAAQGSFPERYPASDRGLHGSLTEGALDVAVARRIGGHCVAKPQEDKTSAIVHGKVRRLHVTTRKKCPEHGVVVVGGEKVSDR
jgi:hypothetical protein